MQDNIDKVINSMSECICKSIDTNNGVISDKAVEATLALAQLVAARASVAPVDRSLRCKLCELDRKLNVGEITLNDVQIALGLPTLEGEEFNQLMTTIKGTLDKQ